MHKVEPVKRLLENATGIGVPTRDEALACVRRIKLRRMKFRDDGYIPNNPKLALLYYRAVIRRVHPTRRGSKAASALWPGPTRLVTIRRSRRARKKPFAAASVRSEI
jgi:hypothetical protein